MYQQLTVKQMMCCQSMYQQLTAKQMTLLNSPTL
jgi:hypothetical protein